MIRLQRCNICSTYSQQFDARKLGKLGNFHRPGQPDSGWLILAGGDSGGDILVCHQGISFWGGVDPDTSRIIDAHHPDHGASLAGRVVMIP